MPIPLDNENDPTDLFQGAVQGTPAGDLAQDIGPSYERFLKQAMDLSRRQAIRPDDRITKMIKAETTKPHNLDETLMAVSMANKGKFGEALNLIKAQRIKKATEMARAEQEAEDMAFRRQQEARQEVVDILKMAEQKRASRATEAAAAARIDETRRHNRESERNQAIDTELKALRLARERDEPKSDIGKIVHDRATYVRMYGEDSPQVTAFDEFTRDKSKPKLTDEKGMRQEFTKLSDDYIKVRDSYGRIKTAAQDPSPAGDLALMFNYMKMLDPGSTVRESEFANVAATGSFGQRLQAAALRFLAGERLAPEMRSDFVARSGLLFSQQERFQKRLEEQYTSLAERAGIAPEAVVIDFKQGVDDMEKGGEPVRPVGIPEEAVYQGKRQGIDIWRTPDGKEYGDIPDAGSRAKTRKP